MVPGFLNWGDVSLATALADGKTAFIDPIWMHGKPVAEAEFSALASEVKNLRKRCGIAAGNCVGFRKSAE